MKISTVKSSTEASFSDYKIIMSLAEKLGIKTLEDLAKVIGIGKSGAEVVALLTAKLQEQSSTESQATESIDSENEVNAFSMLSTADKIEDESIVFYQNLKSFQPAWDSVLDDIIAEELKHKGQIKALLAASLPEAKAEIKDGEAEGIAQLADTTLPAENTAPDALVSPVISDITIVPEIAFNAKDFSNFDEMAAQDVPQSEEDLVKALLG